jgi:hypothetical protein
LISVFIEVLQEIRRDITRKVWKSSQKATKGTNILAETIWPFFGEGDEGNGNPCETVGFLQKETKARKQQAKFKLRFFDCLL